MQINNSTQSFGSTRLNLAKNTPITKITETLQPFFELKGFGHTANDSFVKNPQAFADKITGTQVAIVPSKNGFVIIGKDGGAGGADTFIGKVLKEKFGDAANFTDDIAPSKFEGEIIDFTKLNK